MPSLGNRPITVRVSPEVRERWEEQAKAMGLSLPEFVRQAVERSYPGSSLRPRVPGNLRTPPPAKLVDPKKCTARVRAGSYCRKCGAIHVKGI